MHRKIPLALLLTAAATALAQPAEPAPPAMPAPAATPDPAMIAARGPSLALALEAAQTAVQLCKRLGAHVAVSVVDSAGVLKLLLAADGAFPKAVTSSTAKAITAKELNMPISEISHQMKTDAALAARISANPRYVVGQGGLPLRVGDQVIGAIGVGGAIGNRAQNELYPVVPGVDEQCARAAVAKIQKRLR